MALDGTYFGMYIPELAIGAKLDTSVGLIVSEGVIRTNFNTTLLNFRCKPTIRTEIDANVISGIRISITQS